MNPIDTYGIRSRIDVIPRRPQDLYSLHPNDIIRLYDEIDRLYDEIDRLRAESKPAPQQQEEKTVRVKVVIGVDEGGHWRVAGRRNLNHQEAIEEVKSMMAGACTIYTFSTTLSIPEEKEVEATVEKEE